ncbi:hypothetical protein N7499_001345 [Penicillium canescens]|uniref:Uncharacterized protein n=1 Tax=Penicillium canescens TaxID=5083 RepID=A0AAD6I2Y8_PENCN|nr:hypothetical protein N7460_012703 [Penicillium canescens]KAJ6041170.1 hypothetical protein N7444_010075 [Penicillium canescens]KAJ6101715.1 hypothetical protein N7499_001345 [Penicillium canescens]KAJ6174179.1 hypothetical protein N7485_006991 [Penicillium canescens]
MAVVSTKRPYRSPCKPWFGGKKFWLLQRVAGAIWRNTLLNKLQRYLPRDLKNQAKSIVGSIVVARIYAARFALIDAHVMPSLKNMKLGEYGGAQTEEKEHSQVAENEIEKGLA